MTTPTSGQVYQTVLAGSKPGQTLVPPGVASQIALIHQRTMKPLPYYLSIKKAFTRFDKSRLDVLGKRTT